MPGFDTVEADDLKALARKVTKARWRVGQFLMRRGERGDAMHIIRSGEIKVPIFDDRERLRLVARLGPGDVVGEMALMTGDPRVADVLCEEDAETLVLSRDVMQPFLEEHPGVARFLTEILGQRLEESGGVDRVGKYRVLDKIGEGATSKVYGAVHPGLNRTVALKMLGHHMVYDRRFRDRFIEEARTIAGLSHPNIVQIYDTEQAYATWFIVMERVGGTDLEQLLKETGAMDPVSAADILLQLARGLRFAHSRGIVHRDVKPANTAVEDDGGVKLMDFGIARRVQPGAKRSTIVEGTPRYLAPEAITGKPVDGRVDIYALGVMAFEMVTGRPPYNAATMDALLRLHVSAPVPDLARIKPGLPEGLLAFIRGAMIKDADKRLSDWGQIMSLLEGGRAADTVLDRFEEKILRVRFRPRDGARVDRAIGRFRTQLKDVRELDVAVARLTSSSPVVPEPEPPPPPAKKSWLSRITGKQNENALATRAVPTVSPVDAE